jgi:hypothetical protein
MKDREMLTARAVLDSAVARLSAPDWTSPASEMRLRAELWEASRRLDPQGLNAELLSQVLTLRNFVVYLSRHPGLSPAAREELLAFLEQLRGAPALDR